MTLSDNARSACHYVTSFSRCCRGCAHQLPLKLLHVYRRNIILSLPLMLPRLSASNISSYCTLGVTLYPFFRRCWCCTTFKSINFCLPPVCEDNFISCVVDLVIVIYCTVHFCIRNYTILLLRCFEYSFFPLGDVT